MTWKDERYKEVNALREIDCPSNHVVWTEMNQFWIPSITVLDYLKLVIFENLVQINPLTLNDDDKFQEGFLADQDEHAGQGDRQLRYYVSNGMFYLISKSYAKVHCDMDFKMYPFDTQKCNFVVVATRSLNYQESYEVSLF